MFPASKVASALLTTIGQWRPVKSSYPVTHWKRTWPTVIDVWIMLFLWLHPTMGILYNTDSILSDRYALHRIFAGHATKHSPNICQNLAVMNRVTKLQNVCECFVCLVWPRKSTCGTIPNTNHCLLFSSFGSFLLPNMFRRLIVSVGLIFRPYTYSNTFCFRWQPKRGRLLRAPRIW